MLGAGFESNLTPLYSVCMVLSIYGYLSHIRNLSLIEITLKKKYVNQNKFNIYSIHGMHVTQIVKWHAYDI